MLSERFAADDVVAGHGVGEEAEVGFGAVEYWDGGDAVGGESIRGSFSLGGGDGRVDRVAEHA